MHGQQNVKICRGLILIKIKNFVIDGGITFVKHEYVIAPRIIDYSQAKPNVKFNLPV